MKYVKPERLTEQSLILDVRTPDEIREEALSLPFFNEELSKLNPRDFVYEHNLDGSKTLNIICHSGSRSQRAAELFEKNGFIPKLDQYVWECVCSYLRDWKKNGYPLPVVSVNVSRADIYRSDLVDTLLKITQKYGINPAYLHLEITESAYAENPSQIISTVEELRKLGFIVEMDDFGSGYSSLNMLSRMKLDILKLDMKFIQNEIAKPERQSILNDIISMAHRIELSVVAEGIETREQMKRLKSVGCDYAQGYFFAKPMPAAEFEKLWKEQSSSSLPCKTRKKGSCNLWKEIKTRV